MAFACKTEIEVSGVTDVGTKRALNEDSIAIVRPEDAELEGKGAILVLADGLGGYNAGEVASSLVTSKLPELYYAISEKDRVSDIVAAVRACNSVVHETSLIAEELHGMGTTLVAAVIVYQYAIFANVGDSRGYLFRDGLIIHRTKDHSLRDASFDLPQFNPRHRFSHVLTRAIGPKADVSIDVTTHRVIPGDTILLCSDGLTDCVTDEEIEDVIFNHPVANASQLLVDLAKERNGADNISTIVANVSKVSEPDAERNTRLPQMSKHHMI